ncbi:hypothetical protein MPSEU_000789400 [Mayamaea pseudoterrestris]|nr:hypothetical protein MPSEU_000789400 [Mayamaea pseudoterrestris]
MDADDENESVLMAQVLSDDDGVDDEDIAMAEVCSDDDDDSLEASYLSNGQGADFSSSPSAGQRSDSMQTSPEVTQPETEIRALDYLRSDDVISHDLKLRVTTPPSSPLLHESVVSTSRQVDSLAEEGPAAVETHEFDDHDMQLQALPDLALALVDAQQPAKLEQERLHDDVNAMNNEFETTARRGHVEMVNDGGVHLDHPRSFSSAVNDYQPIVCAETSDGAMAMSDSPCLEKSIDERVDSKPGFSAASPTEYHISDDVQSIHTQIPFQEKIDHNDFLAYLARNNQLLTESLVLVDGSEEAMETLSSNIGKSSHTISFLDQINNCRLLESLSEPAKFVDHENNQRLAATFRRAEDATNDQFAASNVSRNSSNDDVVRMVNCCAFATSNASGGISDDIDALNFVLQRCTLDAADDHSRAENLKTDFHLQETSTTGDHFGEKPSDPAFIMPLNNEDTSKSGSVGCEGSLSLHLLQEGEAEMTQVGSPDKATLLIEDAPLQEIDPPVPPCTVLCLNSNVPAGDSVSPIKSPRLVNFHKSVAWQANDQSTISANGNASLEISLSPSELFHKNSLYVSAESSQGVELTDKENCRPLQSSSLAENKSRRRREGSIMKWSLGTKIGSGAFGVVHIGMNTQTGSLLAIKIVALDDKVVKDVRSEINMLRSFKHVNIVQYLGAENVDGQLHIFQEWVAGGSITGMLVKFGAFPLAVVRNYLSQALEGLSYLHDHKIMHRDIKGANILVSDGGVVKLADFGASKELLNDMMLSHTMRGTPYFMAPEVFEEKYNFKADIWSIGCVGFQMFTANPPWKHFGTTNPVALFNKVKRHGGPPPLTTPASSLDIDIEVARFRALLERTFQFEPMERPSARDMLDDPFFLHSDNYLDDEHSTSYSLFSPCSIGSRGQRSPKGMNIESPAFPRQSVGRIKSGCPPRSPFLSPPLPKRQSLSVGSAMCSPKPDVAEWPTWAREHHGKACSPVAKRSAVAEMSFGSLGYSASTLDKTEASTATDSSSLAGVSFVLSK